MICSTCLLTRPIPLCVDAIVIGAINTPATNVIVQLKNLATQRIDEYTATSSGSNIVTLDSSDIELMESHYEIRILLASNRSTLDVTIGGETSECVTVSFEQCNETVTSVTLELA